MIQEERERRAMLRAQKEAPILAEEARLRAETERLIRENMVPLQKDREFLIALQIPEHLQEIIDEDKLEGAYVLWEPIRPASLRPGETSVIGGSVSLVWNIGYTEGHRLVTNYGGDTLSWGHEFVSRTSLESTGRNGYAYKSIGVYGNSETNSLKVNGCKDELEPTPTYQELLRRFGDENNIPREYRGPHWGDRLYRPRWPFIMDGGYITLKPLLRSRYTSIRLSGQQLNELEIKQALASTYLDTEESLAEEKSSSWPFDKTAPEQDRSNISEKFRRMHKA